MRDTCCPLCRTFLEICQNRGCRCHHQAWRDDHQRTPHRDPTGDTAVNNVMRQQRQNRRRKT